MKRDRNVEQEHNGAKLINEYERIIEEHIRNAEDQHDFEVLTYHLIEGYKDGAFGEPSLVDCLKGIRDVIAGLDQWADDRGLAVPEQPTWQWLCRIMYGGLCMAEGSGRPRYRVR